MELVFDVCGGGAERLTTVQDLYSAQLSLVPSSKSIYYVLRHDKHANVKTESRKACTHKMPHSLVVYFLLYRGLCHVVEPNTAKVFPPTKRRTHEMKHSVATFFHMDPNKIIQTKSLIRIFVNLEPASQTYRSVPPNKPPSKAHKRMQLNCVITQQKFMMRIIPLMQSTVRN